MTPKQLFSQPSTAKYAISFCLLSLTLGNYRQMSPKNKFTLIVRAVVLVVWAICFKLSPHPPPKSI